MYFPPGVIFIWTGLASTIPTGWERVTALDGKFIKGTADATDPGDTGGNATHQHTGTTHSHTDSHTHTVTVSNATTIYNVDSDSGTGGAGRAHSHTATCGAISGGGLSSVACTYSAISNDPPFYEVIFITPTSGVNELPANAIYLYDDDDSLTGHVVCDGSGTSPILGTYSTGLKGYFKFESGAVTTDSSGSSHNLTAVTPASTYKGGKYGDALSFLPMPQYYTIANHADFNPTTLSISFWIKTPVTGYNSMIFTKYGGNYKGWLVRVRSDGKVSFTIGNGGTTNKDSVSTNTVNDNVWHHVACVYNATDLRIYVDGQLDCVPVASGALVSDTAISVHLGKASWYNDNYCSGTIDDLAFWGDRSLTASEVEAIYNHGANTAPNLIDVYLRGAGAGGNAGGTGGSTTNIHTLTHTHTVASHDHANKTTGTPSSQTKNTTGDNDIASGSHTHTINPNATTSTISGTVSLTTTETVEPAYKKLLTVQNQNTGATSYRLGMIGMWLGDLNTIPNGWILCDGSNGTQDMRGKHLKSTSTTTAIGNTGGSNTHTHASQNHTHTASGTHKHTHANLTHTGTTNDTKGSVRNGCNHQETHTVTFSSVASVYSNASTTGNSQNNEPPYRTVAFIKLNSITTASDRSAKITGDPLKVSNDERSAKLSGYATSNDSRDAKTLGKDIANDSRDARLSGFNTANDFRDAKLSGFATDYSERSAKLTGFDTDNDERPAKTTGTLSVYSDRSAKITGVATPADDERSAKLSGKDITNSERSGKTTGKLTDSSTRSAKTTGGIRVTSERQAKITGTGNIIIGYRSAKIHGVDTTNSARSAKIRGRITTTVERFAKITGKLGANSSRLAKLFGVSSADDERSAKLTGFLTANSTRSAKLNGHDTALSDRRAKIHGKLTADSERSAKTLGGVASTRSAKLRGRTAYCDGKYSDQSTSYSEMFVEQAISYCNSKYTDRSTLYSGEHSVKGTTYTDGQVSPGTTYETTLKVDRV